jgi:dihydrodipicolinate synthase/N-acetylneuraminate lyase
MHKATFDPAHLRESVFAVPPLARDASLKISPKENQKLVRFLEAGGIRSILYGGNAVFYHTRLSEYADLLSMIAEISSDETVVVPSIGPSFGVALDQVDLLRDHDFGTVMLLPSRDVVDDAGIATGIRRLVDALGKPIVLYLKIDRWLSPSLIQALNADGAISWIKYAVVRENPSEDRYLREVLDVFPADRVVSGIGEQPAIVHLRDFGVAGFTSGCVCVAPNQSMQMMRAIHDGDFAAAEAIRQWFMPLENLRNEISPIRVLHQAVAEAGIADLGPLMPFLSNLAGPDVQRITAAVGEMLRPSSLDDRRS